VGEQCRCIEDTQKSHNYKMGGFQSIVEIIVLSHKLQKGTALEMAVPSAKQGQGVQEDMSEFQKETIRLGISLEEIGVLVKYLGGLFSHI
jgi:hypothetical protein